MKQQRQNKFLGYLKNVPQTHNVIEDKPKTTDDKYNIYIEYNLLQKRLDKIEQQLEKIIPVKHGIISRIKNFFKKK
tara:strand:+ start:625 stop:852 length:228 start_codon:yes stop_codon:yes gene_type:complete